MDEFELWQKCKQDGERHAEAMFPPSRPHEREFEALRYAMKAYYDMVTPSTRCPTYGQPTPGAQER